MKYLPIIFLSILTLSCGQKQGSEKASKEKDKLPILGNKHVEQSEGSMDMDTVYHTIPEFSFMDQDSSMITNETLSDQIYVSDFFFTSCPTICPTMKAQMLRVYEKYNDNSEVAILSHTIDPEYDDVERLNKFANQLGVSSDKWHFVTGEKDDIYEIGMKGYLVTAGEDETAPGGFIHSGAFILVDKKGRIRGLYDGTVEADVNELMSDIEVLLREYNS